MQRMIAAAFALFSLFCATVPAALAQSITPEQARQLARLNGQTERFISGYTDIVLGEAFNRALDRVAGAPSADGPPVEQALRELAQLEAALSGLDSDLAATDWSVTDFGDSDVYAAMSGIGPFIRELRDRAAETVELYRQQLAALRAGDLDTYDALVLEEVDSTVFLLRGENQFLTLNMAAQDRSLPVLYHFQAIRDSNSVVIAFLSLVGQFSTSTEAEDKARLDEAEQALQFYRKALDLAEKRTRTFCKRKPTRKERASFKRLCSVFAAVNDVNRELDAPLSTYVEITRDIANGERLDELDARLTELDVFFSPLIDKRFALNNQRAEAVLALVEAAN